MLPGPATGDAMLARLRGNLAELRELVELLAVRVPPHPGPPKAD